MGAFFAYRNEKVTYITKVACDRSIIFLSLMPTHYISLLQFEMSYKRFKSLLYRAKL